MKPGRRPARARPNEVAVRASTRLGAALSAGAARSARRFLGVLRLSGVELSISLVGDAAIRRLNRQWREKDRSTDVLSFPVPPVGGGSAPRVLGDVVISVDTARRRARAERAHISAEVDLYLAHGLLHLLGHDHHRAADARRMRRLERRLLGHPGML